MKSPTTASQTMDHLADRVRTLLGHDPRITEKTMFGGLTFLLDGRILVGCKKDVPKCVCYVGKYCGCQGECYAWVTPEQTKILRDFTLLILALVPPDVQEVSSPRLGVGAAFSPGSGS